MDIGTRSREDMGPLPHFSKTRAKCPFSCNLVPLLKYFENAEINRKAHDSGDFRMSKLQNFPREHVSDPPAGLHCLLPRLSARPTFQSCPLFTLLPESLDSMLALCSRL